MEDEDALLQNRLIRLTRKDPVMLFMKGTPTAPKCGFSRQAVELLQAQQVPFGSFDILQDETVRQGLKQQFDWPTFPQVYVHGELQGGLDILQEMISESSGASLVEQWKLLSSESTTSLNDRLHALVHRSPVMVFMKGLPLSLIHI